jgi:hypothetical protein
LLFSASLVACGGPGVGSSSADNMAPRARLSAPLNAPVNESVLLDASSSFDPDGTVVEYTFAFGDDSPMVTQSTPEVSHTFATPGAYEVVVVVRDDGGLLARATQLVVVAADPPTCSAAPDCSLGSECRNSLCYATAAGAGSGAADCEADSECHAGFACRAGLCLAAAPVLH